MCCGHTGASFASVEASAPQDAFQKLIHVAGMQTRLAFQVSAASVADNS